MRVRHRQNMQAQMRMVQPMRQLPRNHLTLAGDDLNTAHLIAVSPLQKMRHRVMRPRRCQPPCKSNRRTALILPDAKLFQVDLSKPPGT